MTNESPVRRDYAAEAARRIAWLKAHMVRKPREIQKSEVQIETEYFKFRIFRAIGRGGWELVTHKRRRDPFMESIGIRYELEGEWDHQNYSTRESVLSWIALHWDYLIDKEIGNDAT